MRNAVPTSFVLCVALAPAQDTPPPVDFGPIQAHLTAACGDCHDGEEAKGRFDLVGLPARGFSADWLSGLARIRERVRTAEMPPPHREPLAAADRTAVLAFCDSALLTGVPKLPWPAGRVTVRRLSRGQWETSVQALFGVATPLAQQFPPDDLGYGFDSIGDALSFSTLHLERFLAAADDVAARVDALLGNPGPTERRYEAESMPLVEGPGISQDGDVAGFYTRATIVQKIDLPRAGDYRLTVRAGADQAGDEPARLRLRLDDRDLAEIDVPQRAMQTFPLTTPLPGGPHTLTLAFVNDHYDPKHPDPARRDRNLRVDWLELAGPLDPPVVPPQAAWLAQALATKDPKARSRAVAQELLLRAWRRPPSADEVARTAALGPRLSIAAALASPNFLFRIEPDTAGRDEALPDLALATRLSFFLWGCGPDDDLRRAALQHRLADPAQLANAALRLLDDARAEWLATDFAAQWLELRALPERTPDPGRFPGITDELRASMRRQTELLFLTVLREGRDVRDLLACDFTFVDARLATFHGLPAKHGDGFERRPLAADDRASGGVLGQASVLLLTSNPTRTSPVKRGKWILDNLLGAAPPAPPPGNDTLAGEAKIDSTASFREQLAQHRAKRECAGCHVRMDALGFALENFDAVGRFRTADRGGAIDTRGELPDGRIVQGLAPLAGAIADDPAFVRTLLTRLFVYAVGRDATPIDRLHLDARADALRNTGKVTLRDLVREVVLSPPFRRRSSAPSPAPAVRR
ncbi:MAG: DUF1592 domain-containing protein [Planctomycetes bacterium]|nr:DUF1592 domain-containing protein [Planctomycetota bacterium]